MRRALISLLLLLPLAGCGVLIPYMYDAQKLQDRLAVSMPKEQVLKYLGKPDRVIQDDGVHAIWEYRLYPKGEWAGYLVHCPLFPNCYFPAEAASPYYVILQDNQVCMWGTPNIVRPLIRIACGTATRTAREDQVKGGFRISVIPVFMPPEPGKGRATDSAKVASPGDLPVLLPLQPEYREGQIIRFGGFAVLAPFHAFRGQLGQLWRYLVEGPFANAFYDFGHVKIVG